MKNIYDFYLDWQGGSIYDYEKILPDEKGVYLVTKEIAGTEPEVIYVGESNNMHKRWVLGHHAAINCIRLGANTIRWFLTDKRMSLEAELIKHFNPPANKTFYDDDDDNEFEFVASEWNETFAPDRRNDPRIKKLEALLPF
jgi:excinuclease UvrABC nuclease subunit